MIEIICPSKGRPEKLRRMWDSARATALHPDKLVLRIGVNEEELELYRPYINGMARLYAVKDWSIGFTLNLIGGDALSDGVAKFLMLMGDDAVFETPGWDKAVYDHHRELTNKAHIYALQDSRSHDGTPHPIISREFTEALGYLVPPIFLHWYADTWLVEIAKQNGLFTHLRDYVLIHDKPSDRGVEDATHKGPRDRGWKERDGFVNATCQHFLGYEIERMRAACL